MINIDRLLQKEDRGSTLFMVSADDLKEFAEVLIKKTIRYVESKYEPKFYTKGELAELFRVSEQTINNYCKRGYLTPIKNFSTSTQNKGRVLFDQRDVISFMKNNNVSNNIKRPKFSIEQLCTI